MGNNPDLKPEESKVKPFLMVSFAALLLVAGVLILTDATVQRPVADEPVVVETHQPVCENDTVCHLYDFIKFIDWPADGMTQDFNVCVMGGNFLGSDIYHLDRKPVRNSQVRVLTDVALSQILYCHVIILHEDAEGIWPQVHEKLQGKPILSISNIPAFASKGGMIELKFVKDRLKFKASQKNIENAGLRASSKLLSLGK